MALGVTIFHDRTTPQWQNTGGSVAYAYHVPLTKDKAHVLAIGLQAGVNSLGLNNFTPNDGGDTI
jgi:hypothetical protein